MSEAQAAPTPELHALWDSLLDLWLRRERIYQEAQDEKIAEIKRLTKESDEQGFLLGEIAMALDGQASEFGQSFHLVRQVADLTATVARLESCCQAVKCACGHFGCAHNGPLFRGLYTCSVCDCDGFRTLTLLAETGQTEKT